MTPTATADREAEHPALRRCHRASRLLDEAVRLPDTDVRVGLDPLVGLLLSLYPVLEAVRLGPPSG